MIFGVCLNSILKQINIPKNTILVYLNCPNIDRLVSLLAIKVIVSNRNKI